MPSGWSRRYEFSKLADTHSELDYAIPVGELARGTPGISECSGPLQVHVRFCREQGWPVAEMRLSGEVGLTCQRCLQPMRQPVSVAARVVLLASEAEAERAPPEDETFLAPEGWVSAAELAAEELLLALPQAPRHANVAECQFGAQAPAEEEKVETQRPFADLRALLKRS